MHKVFISYHHKNDQDYKDDLLRLNESHNIFINYSVETGDIDPDLDDEIIRTKIRDEYLRDSTVTILLVGSETKNRKHVDWEIYSSMIDGKINKKSGIVVIQLPSAYNGCDGISNDNEKEYYPSTTIWENIDTRAKCKSSFPCLPERIVDNVVNDDAYISIVSWKKVSNDVEFLKLLINNAFENRSRAKYDLSSPMRKNNS